MIDNIGARIKLARKNEEMTLKEVAFLTDLSVSYLSDLERGRTEPSLKTLRKLCDVLQLDIYDDKFKLSYDELEFIEMLRDGNYSKLLIMIAGIMQQSDRKQFQ